MRSAIIVIAIGIAGCATIREGQDFNAEARRGFQEGSTTARQVRMKLGEPWRREISRDQETWTYTYKETNAHATTATVLFKPFVNEYEAEVNEKNLRLVFKKGILDEMTYFNSEKPQPRNEYSRDYSRNTYDGYDDSR